ncbi:hypothetical protein SKAU_G00140780 [Synaphobranchus kaupii]|uniref:Uncharacterized protein n=1 Tax=Synaphobranchus kaupii TaxID=118154 RepID=A0A9Q1FT67_SYNKA|nr:hypothetical protein SKAU_G00140780 [Synaphobranchus kaupii]
MPANCTGWRAVADGQGLAQRQRCLRQASLSPENRAYPARTPSPLPSRTGPTTDARSLVFAKSPRVPRSRTRLARRREPPVKTTCERRSYPLPLFSAVTYESASPLISCRLPSAVIGSEMNRNLWLST